MALAHEKKHHNRASLKLIKIYKKSKTKALNLMDMFFHRTSNSKQIVGNLKLRKKVIISENSNTVWPNL